MLRVITTALLLLLWAGPSHAQSCSRATIMSPAPFRGNEGEILKLHDETIWQVKRANQFFYESYPNVVICPSRQTLLIRGKSLSVELLSSTSAVAANTLAKELPQFIESRIDGTFDGWSGETIFKLENGQLWQQASFASEHAQKYRPRVVITRTGAGFEMQVEGLAPSLRVQLLQ